MLRLKIPRKYWCWFEQMSDTMPSCKECNLANVDLNCKECNLASVDLNAYTLV